MTQNDDEIRVGRRLLRSFAALQIAYALALAGVTLWLTPHLKNALAQADPLFNYGLFSVLVLGWFTVACVVMKGAGALRQGASLFLYLLLLATFARNENPGLVNFIAGTVYSISGYLLFTALVTLPVRWPSWQPPSSKVIHYAIIGAAAGFFMISATLSQLLFAGLPHCIDSIAQYIHAKWFAAGQLYGPSMPHREFYTLPMMINDGRWYSQYPPGHVAMMAIGHLLHATWIICPLLGAATLWLVYKIGKEYYGLYAGAIAALLFLISPWMVLMSSEQMNHPTSLFFCTLFLLAMLHALKHSSARWAMLAGAAIGYAFITRPLSAAAVGAPFVLYLAAGCFHHGKSYYRLAAAALMPFLLFVGVQLLFNELTNGDPFMYGYVKLQGWQHLPGFGPSQLGGDHTVAEGLWFTAMALDSLNLHLLDWALPALLLPAVSLIARPRHMPSWLLIGVVVSLMLAHIITKTMSFTLYGPRYLYEAAVPLLILTADGLVQLAKLMPNKPHNGFAVALTALCMLATGWAAHGIAFMRQFPSMGLPIAQANEAHMIAGAQTPAIIFFPSTRELLLLAHHMPQSFDASILFVHDQKERNRELMDAYPNRHYYRYSDHGTLEEMPAN